MAEFLIKDGDLVGLKGKVVIVTGGSSGIGLATVELLVSSGAKVVSGDVQDPPKPITGDFLFVKTDVRSWTDLAALFKKTKEQYGRVDHVFVNAGIAPRANYLELASDENGDLQEPTRDTVDINYIGVINTSALAVHYLKSEGGSIVIMASSTALHGTRAMDYSSAKSGALGFGRGLAVLVKSANLPIRVNLLAPSWTSTQVLPNVQSILQAVQHDSQSPSVVARATVYLMLDASRNGEVIFINDGKYKEIGEAELTPVYERIKGKGPSDDEILGRIFALSG